MTDVFLRHFDNADAVKIGEVPFTEAALDAATRLVKAWSVQTDEDDYAGFHSGQFVLRGGRAYFEIVVGAEDE